MPEISMVVLGAGAVGKSCIAVQFIQGHFVDKYDSSIEEVYRKAVEVDGVNYVLTIVDTAGQEAFSTMRETYMKTGQAFILIYSITDSESFHQLKRIHMQLRRIRGDGPPCIVVANKSDLSGQRAVASSEGEMFARQVNCEFAEISAKNRLAVEDVFTALVRTVARGRTGPSASLAVAETVTDGGRTDDDRLPPINLRDPPAPRNDDTCWGIFRREALKHSPSLPSRHAPYRRLIVNLSEFGIAKKCSLVIDRGTHGDP
jgi:small GTP-binding protein